MIKILPFNNKLFAGSSKGRQISQCSRKDCNWSAEWAYIDSENLSSNRAYCTPHAVVKAKSEKMALSDLPMKIGELVRKGETGEVTNKPTTPEPSRTVRVSNFESWLVATTGLADRLESEIKELKETLQDKESQLQTMRMVVQRLKTDNNGLEVPTGGLADTEKLKEMGVFD